ncbi:MAG TPA: PRC-barrel domain-containing protein, partial [Gemmataceae bacterium]|nr:PRC-barrel domain-containing protein [Gemmataceae bacterium]
IGTTVHLENNVTYGKVANFVINEDGCVQYLVIAYESDYAFVPWSVVHYEQNVVRVDVTREKIRDVTFEKGRMPDFSSATFTRRVQTVFGGNRSRRGQTRSREQGTTETQEPRGSRRNDQNNRPGNQQPSNNNNRDQNLRRPNPNQNPNQGNPNQRGDQQNQPRPGTAPRPNQAPPAPPSGTNPNRNPNQQPPGNTGRQPNQKDQRPPQ